MLLRWLFLILLAMIIAGTAYGADASEMVQAKEVLDKIRSGQPAEYDNCIISGELNLDGQEARGPIHFNHTIFQDAVNFESTNFNNNAYFGGSQFKGDANFRESRFYGDANFRGSQFYYTDTFARSQFNRDADFSYSKFNNDALFQLSKFNGDADFSGSHFNGYAYFGESQFNDDINFLRSQFNLTVNFSESRFYGDTYFWSTQFNGDAAFENSRFYGNTYFGNSRFKGDVLGCDSIVDYMEDKVTYRSLIKNLIDRGQFYEADNCYYAFRYHHMSNILDYLSWVSCGFGIRWIHALAFGIYILVAFTFIYLFRAQPLTLKARNLSKLITKQKLYESLLFSLIILISAPSDLYPYGYKRYNNYITRNRYFIILERMLGWSLLILLINTVSRVLVRY